MNEHGMRHTLLSAVAAVAAATMLTSCGPPASDPSTAPVSADEIAAALEEETHLTVWADSPWIHEAVAAFEAEHPAIDIDILGSDDMYGPTAGLGLTIEIGEHIPDLVETWGIETDVRLGYLADLTRFGAEDLESSFVPAAWDSVAFADGVWALPVGAAPWTVSYRADVLEAAGVEGLPQTWEEFAAAAEAVKAQTGRYMTALSPYELQWLLRQDAPRLVDWDGGNEIVVDITNPAVERTTDYWDQLIHDDLVRPATGAWWTEPGAVEEVASVMSPGTVYSEEMAGTAAQWTLAPLPQWDPAEPSFVGDVGTTQLVIPAPSEHPLAAYALMQWIASADMGVGVIAPVTVDGLEDEGWLSTEATGYGGQQVNRVLADETAMMTFAGHDLGLWGLFFLEGTLEPGIVAVPLYPQLEAWEAQLIENPPDGYVVTPVD